MKKITTIVDHIGRLVMGEEVSKTETHLTLNNPVIIHVQPNPQNGQLQVQSFPYIFMEFLSPESRDKNEWTFNLNNIVVSDVQLDSKITMQYKNVNSPSLVPGQQQGQPDVIKLFDEE